MPRPGRLSALALLAAALAAELQCAVATKYARCPRTLRFAVGTYTMKPWLPEASGPGVVLTTLGPAGLATDTIVPKADMGENPTYCEVGPSGAMYCCTGGDSSMTQLRRLSKASPKIIKATQPALGANHMAVLRRPARGGGDRVLVADYRGKLQAWAARGDDPSKWDYSEYVVPKDLTSNATFRQEGPHPHQALELANGDVLMCDLGADRVFRFSVGPRAELTLKDSVLLQRGDGTRHAAAHPRLRDTVYVLNELSVTIVRLRIGRCRGYWRARRWRRRGAFVACERRALLDKPEAPPFGGPIKRTAAALRVSADGRFLYATVRVLDKTTPGSVVVFRLKRDGSVGRKVGTYSAQGVQPRDLIIVERFRDENGRCKSFVAVANRDSNAVMFIPRDPVTGALGNSVRYRLNVGTPTSVLGF